MNIELNLTLSRSIEMDFGNDHDVLMIWVWKERRGYMGGPL